MPGEGLDVGQRGVALTSGMGALGVRIESLGLDPRLLGLRREGTERERPAYILGRQAMEAYRPAPQLDAGQPARLSARCITGAIDNVAWPAQTSR